MHFALAVCLAVSGTITSAARADGAGQPAAADAATEASNRFHRGIQLYKEGDHTAALMEFRRAYELAPNYRVLFNMGQVYVELRDYARALDAFQRFLDGGAAEITPDRRTAVEGDLEKLRGRVARLTIECTVQGAELSVDDEVLGVTPTEKPLTLNPGRHRVGLRRAGYEPVIRVIDVAAAETPIMRVDLQKTGEPAAAAPQPAGGGPATAPTTEAPRHSSQTLTWIGLGTTVALAGGAITTGILAMDAKAQRDEELAAVPGDPAKLSSLESQAKGLALASDILLGATIVAGGLTVVSWLTSRGGSDAASSTGARISFAGSRMVLSGQF